MLLGLAIILIVGISLGKLANLLKLPPLIGMLIGGILLSPSLLNGLDSSIYELSPTLRQIALIIILTRAGLSMDISILRKTGLSTGLLCFMPAFFEIVASMIFAPIIFGCSIIEAALLGTVIAAVSPAVIVPKMISLINDKRVKDKSIPQMIMTAASADDVLVIILFYSVLDLLSGQEITPISIILIPVSIILGIIIGFTLGKIMAISLDKLNLHTTLSAMMLLATSFVLVALEESIKPIIPYSGLIGVMAMGFAVKVSNPTLTSDLTKVYRSLWEGAQIFLFVLVGALIDVNYALAMGVSAIVLLMAVNLVRALGIYLSLKPSNLPKSHKLFAIVSYCPKATVQAAIGGIPLTMGLASGELILSMSVVTILITAPIGAMLMDKLTPKLFDS